MNQIQTSLIHEMTGIGMCRAYYAYGSKYFYGKQIEVIVQESGLKEGKGN